MTTINNNKIMNNKFTPEIIDTLKENEVFVFGSNLNGNHAGGAARTAVEKFGAVTGKAEGIQGQSYAIPTLNENMDKVSDKDLVMYLKNFSSYAKENPNKTFYLTKIGCGIAGFDTNYMACMVVKAMFPDNVIVPSEFTEITGYKGFNQNMTCRDFQYKIGKHYEEKEKIEACSRGFHFCENPFDVFGYYTPSNGNGMNKFCLVKGCGDISFDIDDSKVACSKIYISDEIGLKGMIDAGVKFILNKVNWKDNKNTNTGYRSVATNAGRQSVATNTGYGSVATNTGNRSAATNAGNCSVATNAGDYSVATNTGDYSAATNTGYGSAATNTGYGSAATNTGYGSAATNAGNCSVATNAGRQSVATNTGSRSAATNTGYGSAATNTGSRSAATNAGDRSAATNTGNYSVATNAGDYSVATNAGNCSSAIVEGKESIAIVTGRDCKAKGAIGCWIVITECDVWNGESYPIKEMRAFKVDGSTIKSNTWYKLVDGKAVEVE